MRHTRLKILQLLNHGDSVLWKPLEEYQTLYKIVSKQALLWVLHKDSKYGS